MKKTLPVIGLCSLTLVAAMAFFTSDSSASANITSCDAGTDMSYHQAKEAMAEGLLIMARNPDLSTNRITVVITNNTPCGVPLSLATYKMFGPYSLATQSEQEFFEGTPVANVGPNSTVTLEANLPSCAAQYDIWYGAAPVVIPNNEAYGAIMAGDQVRQDQFCQTTPVVVVPPPVVPASVVVVPPPVILTVATPTPTPVVPDAPITRRGGGGGGGPCIGYGCTTVVPEPVPTIEIAEAFVPGLPDTGYAPRRR